MMCYAKWCAVADANVYHTGSLAYDVFAVLVMTLKRFDLQYYASWEPVSVTLENQLLLTVMKLTMNSKDADLADSRTPI